MNNGNITVLNNQEILGQNFTVYGDLDNPLFLAKDVAEMIGHSKVSMMLEGIDDDEKLKEVIFTSGQAREMWLLTEYGLYEVLMQSRKPIAKEFKKEVKALLKQLRQTGVIITESATEEAIDYQAKYGKYKLKKTFMNATDLKAEYEQYAALSKIERDAHRIDNKERIRDTKTIMSVIEERMTDIVNENPVAFNLTEIVLLQDLLSRIQSDLTTLYNKRNSGIKSAQTKKIQQLKEENQQLKNQNNIDEFKDLSSFYMVPRHSFTVNRMLEARNGHMVNSYQYRTWLDRLNLSDFLPPVIEDVDFTGKLKLTIGFVSIESMDLDNQIKAIQDALSHYYSFNDNQIAVLNAVRLNVVDSYEEGRMYIKITNINTGDDDEEK
jgi:prophage antirepressor-like protein/Holliday junction resolvase RusA-like endonuclease